MRYLLPLAMLGFVVMFLAGMPWRRHDPRHEFILEMWERLAEEAPGYLRPDINTPAPQEIHSHGYRAAAGHRHGAGGSHV